MNYKRTREIPDPLIKFKFLEYTYAALVKHVAVTFVAMSADFDDRVAGQATLKIFSSTSLGGWVDAIDLISRDFKRMSAKAQEYMARFSDSPKSSVFTDLVPAEDRLRAIYKQLGKKGYNMPEVKNLSIRRFFRSFVEIRNKCAHGALDLTFYDEVESDFYAILKALLASIPFEAFTMYCTRGEVHASFV